MKPSTSKLLRSALLSILTLAPTGVMAQQGSITFSPQSSVAIPTMGGGILILLALLLATSAWQRFRTTGSGVASTVLLTAALATGAGGLSVLPQVTAGIGLQILSPENPTTFELQPGVSNLFSNESGVDQRVSGLTLPGTCAAAGTPADGVDSACQLGSIVAAGGTCSVDCRENLGLLPGQVLRVDGSAIDVEFVLCGEGISSCTAATARQACQDVGKRVVSHASDSSETVYSLGASESCQWSISYYNSSQNLPDGACLAGVSNLDWSSCCGGSSWHGNTVPFAEAGSVFGYVDSSNSGYFEDQPNDSGQPWGCQSEGQVAAVPGTCSSVYVACTGAADAD